MSAPTERVISIMVLVLVISICFLVPKAAAQSDKYSKMAPVDRYLMERNAEILLARSAAPDSISSDATILVLGRQGYETAVRGKNGFVCMVIESRLEALRFLRELGSPKSRVKSVLVYVPSRKSVTDEQKQIDPFAVYAECGAIFPEDDGDEFFNLCLLAS